MRTQEQIVTRMAELVASDARMDHEYSVLLPCLDFDHARPFLRPEATADAWETTELTRTDDAVEGDVHRCMAGAWATIQGHDRVQADRLVGNCRAYLWLLGTDEEVATFDVVGFHPFGGPKFGWLSERRGWPAPQTLGAIRMAQGMPCTALCISGCRPSFSLPETARH